MRWHLACNPFSHDLRALEINIYIATVNTTAQDTIRLFSFVLRRMVSLKKHPEFEEFQYQTFAPAIMKVSMSVYVTP